MLVRTFSLEEIKELIHYIWEDLLEEDLIDRNHHFQGYDLGDSLTLVSLATRLQNEFNVIISPAELFKINTINTQAQLILDNMNSNTKPEYKYAVEIHKGDTKPVFLFHGAGGGIFVFYDLAKYMDSNQTVWAFQSGAVLDPPQPHTDLESMAKDYISEMLKVQPEGPYDLVGYSMGGSIIYVVLFQLLAMDKEIGKIIFLDSMAPNQRWVTPKSIPDKIKQHLKNILTEEGVKNKVDYIINRLRRIRPEWKFEPEELTPSFAMNMRACEGFNPTEKFPGHLYIFRTMTISPSWDVQFQFFNVDKHMGWDTLFDSVESLPAEGNHFNLIREPYVRTLAKDLQILLKTSKTQTTIR